MGCSCTLRQTLWLLALAACSATPSAERFEAKALSPADAPAAALLILVGGDAQKLASFRSIAERGSSLVASPARDVVETLAWQWLLRLPREDRPDWTQDFWRSLYPDLSPEVWDGLRGYPVLWLGDGDLAAGPESASTALEATLCGGGGLIDAMRQRGYAETKVYLVGQGHAGVQAALASAAALVDDAEATFCGSSEVHLLLAGNVESKAGKYPRVSSSLHLHASGTPTLSRQALPRALVQAFELPAGQELAQQTPAMKAAREYFFARSEKLISTQPDASSPELRVYGSVERARRLSPRSLLRWRHSQGHSQEDVGRRFERDGSVIGYYEFHSLDQPIYLRMNRMRGLSGSFPLVDTDVGPKVLDYLANAGPLLPIPIHVGVGSSARRHETFTYGDICALRRFFAPLATSESRPPRISFDLAVRIGMGAQGQLGREFEECLPELRRRSSLQNPTLVWNGTYKAIAPVPQQLGALQLMMGVLLVASTPLGPSPQGVSCGTSAVPERLALALEVLDDILYWVVADRARHDRATAATRPLSPADYLQRYFLPGRTKGHPAQEGERPPRAHGLWQAEEVQRVLCLRSGESEDSDADLDSDAFRESDAGGCLVQNGERIPDALKLLPQKLRQWWYGGECERRVDASWESDPRLRRLLFPDPDESYRCEASPYELDP